MTDKGEWISWSDMSEKDKADFFSGEPFNTKNYDGQSKAVFSQRTS